MLSSFDLDSGITPDGFRRSLQEFTNQMSAMGLLESVGPLGRRVRHPVMDTDRRQHEYYFIISFRDREQCDRAVAQLQPGQPPANEIHEALYAQITNPVFVCWEDVS